MILRDPRPDARETWLLRAALGDGDAARAAWAAWRADADLDRIDQASFRLLPLAYRNLARLGVTDPWDGALRGFYRRAWCENQVLFRRIAGVLEALARAGVRALVLKGAALASPVYGDAGTRPMADADLLVRGGDFVAAVRALAREGWVAHDTTAGAMLEASPAAFRERYDAIGLRQAGDALPVLDLHDRLLHVYGHHRVDFPEAWLWADAEPFELGGATARRLSPAHALLHVAFHGYQRQHVGPIRWVADVDRLVRADGPRIDWRTLLRQAREARVLAPLRDALETAATVVGTPVPSGVRRALRRERVTAVERFERALRLGTPAWAADYGRTLAPVLRRVRSRERLPWPGWRRTFKEAWRLAYKLPRRHVRRALAGVAGRR